MEQWKEYRIGDICSMVCSGGTPSSKHSEYYDGDIPWLNTKEINFNRIYGTEKCITEEGLNNSSAKWIKENSVIVAMYGATAGKAAIAKIPLTTNQACCNLAINPSVADYRFVYYFLCYKFVELASLANGGAQQNLNAQIIKDFVIPLPSLLEQERIANILSTLDDKIEVNKQINDNFRYAVFEVMLMWLLTSLENDNLEKQSQALFKSWFVDFEPFSDDKFVETEIGMIPQGWSILAFKEFVEPSKEKAPVDCLPEYSVTNKGIIPREAKFKKKLSKSTSMNKVLRKDDLVFGMSREILNWGIMEDEIGGVSSAYNIYILNQQIVNPIYLKLYMRAKISDFNSLIGTAAREGQGLDKGQLMQKHIYIPKENVLQDFFKIYLPIVSAKQNLEAQVNKLVSLRDTLLPQLMSGGLAVNNSIV